MFFFKISTVVSRENQDPNCKDLSKACPYWAENGFCKLRRDFMLKDCKLSCNACGIGKLCEAGVTCHAMETIMTCFLPESDQRVMSPHNNTLNNNQECCF